MPSISLFIALVMVHVSAPYSKILSTVERKKLILNLRGKSDFHMLSSRGYNSGRLNLRDL